MKCDNKINRSKRIYDRQEIGLLLKSQQGFCFLDHGRIQSQLDRTVIRHIYNEQTVQQVEKILEGGTHIFIKFSECFTDISGSEIDAGRLRDIQICMDGECAVYFLRNAVIRRIFLTEDRRNRRKIVADKADETVHQQMIE